MVVPRQVDIWSLLTRDISVPTFQHTDPIAADVVTRLAASLISLPCDFFGFTQQSWRIFRDFKDNGPALNRALWNPVFSDRVAILLSAAQSKLGIKISLCSPDSSNSFEHELYVICIQSMYAVFFLSLSGPNRPDREYCKQGFLLFKFWERSRSQANSMPYMVKPEILTRTLLP